MSGDDRWSDENLTLWADLDPDEEPPELTADEQRRIADLVRYGAPVDDLPDIATYAA